MIEKRITQPLLESGQLTLTERECNALTLPEHSSSIDLELDGEPFHAQWSGRSRQLTGDVLTERLQDYGQDGGLLRLRLVDQVYRLQLLPPGTISQLTVAPPPAPITTRAKATKTKRRATVDRQFHADTEYDWGTSGAKTIGFLAAAKELLGEQLKAAGFDPLELVELRLQGEELATLDDFEELLAVDVANVDRMPHQESVARHALSRLRGRAVLADEVGLGKTIEAGLAVKELALRGLAKRVLILCPAPLREQWRDEMNQKFDLAFDIAYRGPEIKQQDKLILSLTLGRSNADQLTKKPWDVVIIDEAHRAAGQGARKTRDLITSLTTACRYAFFLTATPVQNDLLELYRLVELLRPGTFESVNAFKRQFMQSYDPRTPNDPAALRRLISSVMVRTTRAQAGVDRVTRRAVDVPVDLGPRERELYALSTDLLRNVMRDSGDTMRRRSLALRLTASPFSMGTTALRMADRHPDHRVREVLGRVGHLAMDIQGSARENKAIEITRKWLRDHGRVLIFTQHTDTVTGLLRRMATEGIVARSFHGSMSASERAATIAAFRSGDAPVMISTDAGAEGQNLQFCNCVLNYDLPWNPMRIEQRIGRVDRLTQPKDEVHIANLYARGTIDESVYKLLAEKLRMFELLFGQVTTILGELDEAKSATFETRVLEALFADNDKKMEGLLGKLGTELVHAREKASELIAADSGLSNWMAEAFEHRKGLTKAGSNELAPEAIERARMRQRRVQSWVRSVLKALDVQLLHDTGEGDGAFLTAQFDEEFDAELGGRTLMHLAFDRLGLEHHPDAELCAVGSPVFDELLGLLRVRGDMHATVPVIPEDIGGSPLKHAPNVTLMRRRLVPSGSWSGQATYRATVGEAETTEHLITADINGHSQQRLARRPLREGETLPSTFGITSNVIAAFDKAAASQLERLRRDRSKKVESDQAVELGRITTGYRAQISEATGEDRARLQRALRSEERRLNRQPDVRARAKILALTLDENDWLAEETWAGPNGSQTTLTYAWEDPEPPLVESDASGEPIEVLALCSDSHTVDMSETLYCGSCDQVRCQACGSEAEFADCPLCGTPSCGTCRTVTGGLCRPCASPTRATELDEEFAVGWRLNGGAALLVGPRTAELVRAGGWSQMLVPDADVQDRDRQRVRSYVKQQGLPLDCGLMFRDLTNRARSEHLDRVQLKTLSTINVELSVAAGNNTDISSSTISDVPQAPAVEVLSERAFHVESLLLSLRLQAPPPLPPAVLVTHRATFTDVYMGSAGLIKEQSATADDESLEVIETHAAPFQWHEPTTQSADLASADLEGLRVSLLRRNEAVLVECRDTSTSSVSHWAAVPDGHTVNSELGWFEYLQSLGMPGGKLGKSSEEVLSIVTPFPEPSECKLVERTIKPFSELAEPAPGAQLISADQSMLELVGVKPNTIDEQRISTLPVAVSRGLLERATAPFTTGLRNGLEITEAWQGHGRATHRYRVFDGRALIPVLGDRSDLEQDFGVCRDGHFYAAGSAALCGSCDSWSCRACDEATGLASLTCAGCDVSVCPRCAAAEHVVPTASCVLCRDCACAECGRDPSVIGCEMCGREMCSSCRCGTTCPACAQLTPATEDQVAQLPVELIGTGSTALVGSDADAMVVLLNRGGVYEQAIIRSGAIARWNTYGRSTINHEYELRLASSHTAGTQVVPVQAANEPDPPLSDPHVVVQSEKSYFPAWSLMERGIQGRATNSFVRPEADLMRSVAREFATPPLLPQPSGTVPPAMKAVVRSMPQPSPLYLQIYWEKSGFELAVTSKGVSNRSFDGTEEHSSFTAWTWSEGPPMPWISADWEPAPLVCAHALSSDAEAALVSIASLRVLGVRTSKTTIWYTVSASEGAVAATALARWIGLSDADEVSVFTDPRTVKLSSVTNATTVAVTSKPTGSLSEGRKGFPGSSASALAAWAPPTRTRTPQLQQLPEQLRRSLEQAMGPFPPWTQLDIGAQIQQLSTMQNGHDWLYRCTLPAGQTDARRTNAASGHVLDAGVIDREGHFGIASAQCRYCGGITCAVCTSKTVACDCCTIAICKLCIREPHENLWLCPACIATRPPTRSEARGHGRLLFTRRMLIGNDPLHAVVFERSKQQWTRRDSDNEKHLIANPSVNDFLDERLAQDG
ncbi:DEAD/DEAH box helicase [Mycobacterium frederiksbergense]|uniref:DEAD/DEAH box helicase n=1 Tax=Mycolicibacterium frederiksbergense TaxID=117567 RepID=UPI0021F391C8|nr:SNF2-related protein [Mycolicibacterium frederiksbergense]MCV7046765.1 DEAD/DEAH box helicase [Mycolicibacterium frederiksbergense]